jgi:adapter protein MecA 1/2
MRIEINHDNTILLFIDHSELVERGFLMENHSENVELINEIVDDVLLFAASSTDYFSIDGSYVTEASYVPNEGAYIKITMLHDQVRKINDKQVSHTSNLATPVYVFAHVDDLIDCAMKVPAHLRETGSVYHYQNRYYLLLDESDAQEDRDRSLLVAIVLEYGTKTDLPQAVLLEYGKTIWDADALKQIADVFK